LPSINRDLKNSKLVRRISSWIFVQDKDQPVERRKKIDPRYRDPDNLEFKDKRKNPMINRRQAADPRFLDHNNPEFIDRRRRSPYGPPPAAADKPRLHNIEHPPRKTLLITGIVAGIILILLLSFTFFLSNWCDSESRHGTKKSVNPIVGY